LIDDPVVVSVAEPGSAELRIDGTGPAIEDFDPREFGEAVGEALCRIGIVEVGEGVVSLDEAELSVSHLPGQPIVAVDVNLDGEGEPGLDADVHQAEFGIEVVVVENALRSPGEGQTRPSLAM
jgi:hypothetical protein